MNKIYFLLLSVFLTGFAQADNFKNYRDLYNLTGFYLINEDETMRVRSLFTTEDFKSEYSEADLPVVPEDCSILPFVKYDANGTKSVSRLYVVRSHSGENAIHRNMIHSCQIIVHEQFDAEFIEFTFSEQGRALFKKITSTRIGDTIALVLEGEIVAYARILEPISGNVNITVANDFTAERILQVLRSE